MPINYYLFFELIFFRKSWCCSLEGKYMLFLIKEAEFLLLNIQRDYMIDDAIEVFEESDKESAWDKEVTEKKPLDKDKSSTDTKSIKDIELGVGCEAGLCASLEQAFSCLFHYPKKNRTKNYHDHSTQPVSYFKIFFSASIKSNVNH